MKKTTTILLAGTLLLGAATVGAQTPTAPRKPFGTGELPEFLKPYDLDGDGKLSVEERQAFEKACREARPNRPGMENPWDTDGDGVLSEAERLAARAAIEAKMTETRTARFEELDTSGDGFLTSEELSEIPRITSEMVTRMIEFLDQDKDGRISLEEFLAVMKPPFPLPQPLPKPIPTWGLMCLRPLAVFDVDKNGRLSAAEITAMMAELDTDADGRVSPDEWAAYLKAHPEALPEPPMPPGGGGPGPGPGPGM